jgi:hypothetical protein
MEKEKQKIMADDSSLLKDEVVRLFNSHFKETLDVLSSRFAHIPGDNSQNELEFKGLRAKILRSGNNKLRQLPDCLADFCIVKTHDTVVETTSVNTPVKVKQ